MRILIVSQYFWPEQFRINDLATALVKKGHYVEVLTGRPNYGRTSYFPGYSFRGPTAESWNGINIKRVKLLPRGAGGNINLVLNYLSFIVFASWRALFMKGSFDRVFVFATSPITAALPAIVYKKRTGKPILLWVQDLWPETVVAVTRIRKPVLLDLLSRLSSFIYNHCDRILIQSEAYRSSVLAHGAPPEKIIFYPNSAEELYGEREAEPHITRQMPEGFVIMFAGNIGEAQGFDTILKAAREVAKQNSRVKWVILGDGRRMDFVKQKVSEYGLEKIVHLFGRKPLEEMPGYFAAADCLLVSLKKSPIFHLTIPSKIQSYLACGKPILGSLDGEGARIITESGAGLAAPADDFMGLATQALHASELPRETLVDMGKKAAAYYRQHFDRARLLNELEEILETA